MLMATDLISTARSILIFDIVVTSFTVNNADEAARSICQAVECKQL